MSKNKLLILVTWAKSSKCKPIINVVSASLKKKKKVNGKSTVSLDTNSRQQPHVLSPIPLQLTEVREGMLPHQR